MGGQLVGEVDGLMRPPLRYHDDTTDLLHLGVIWRAGAVQVARNLEKQKRSRWRGNKIVEQEEFIYCVV